MKKYIIDRIMDETVVLETEEKTIRRVPRCELPDGIAEGQVLSCGTDGWRIEEAERDVRRASVKRKLDTLFGKRDRT